MTLDMTCGCVIAVLGLAACSPTLNWREVRPEGADAVAMFPCKPQRLARQVPLAGGKFEMGLASCAVDGVTYALSHLVVKEPTQVTQALEELRAAAAGNIGGTPTAPSPLSVNGMTPNPQAQRWTLQGKGADGKAVNEQVGFFARGLRVYQATVIGPKIDAEAAETFFGGIKLSS